MSTSSSAIRESIMIALRDESVALSAGIAYATWASTTTPRVFPGNAGFIGGRNRGRLPFVEVVFTGQSFDNHTDEGGTMVTTAHLIAHGTGRDQETAEEVLSGILCSALASIRDIDSDNYMRLGSDKIEQVQPGPFGWKMVAELDIEHSYTRSDYEAP